MINLTTIHKLELGDQSFWSIWFDESRKLYMENMGVIKKGDELRLILQDEEESFFPREIHSKVRNIQQVLCIGLEKEVLEITLEPCTYLIDDSIYIRDHDGHFIED